MGNLMTQEEILDVIRRLDEEDNKWYANMTTTEFSVHIITLATRDIKDYVIANNKSPDVDTILDMFYNVTYNVLPQLQLREDKSDILNIVNSYLSNYKTKLYLNIRIDDNILEKITM